MAKWGLIAVLIIELLAAAWPKPIAVEMKNRLASWPGIQIVESQAQAMLDEPKLIDEKIAARNQSQKKQGETRNGQIELAYLSWQIYRDDEARIYWQRAFYLDPLFVVSLPVQLF